MATALNIEVSRGASPTDKQVVRAAYAQRAFPRSQELLAGTRIRTVPRAVTVTWHDLGLSVYPGAFAIANDLTPDVAALVGTVIQVSVHGRSVYVHVIGSNVLDEDLSLSRRAYLALAPFNVDPITCSAEVVGDI